jgi:type VI secretion system protein ImpL
LLPRLDVLQSVTRRAQQYWADTPVAMRWGLYQGNSLGNAAGDAYARELDGALLPEVADRIKRRLGEYGAEPEKLYEYLKAYLMLDNPSHLDKQQLLSIADLEWKTGNPESAAALSAHFAELLNHEDKVRRIPADPNIVAQARRTIRQASLAGLVYRYIGCPTRPTRARCASTSLPVSAPTASSAAERSAAGQADSRLLYRTRLQGGDRQGHGRPGRAVGRRAMGLGEDGAPVVSSTEVRTTFLDLYEKDYIATWDEILRDVQPHR